MIVIRTTIGFVLPSFSELKVVVEPGRSLMEIARCNVLWSADLKSYRGVGDDLCASLVFIGL